MSRFLVTAVSSDCVSNTVHEWEVKADRHQDVVMSDYKKVQMANFVIVSNILTGETWLIKNRFGATGKVVEDR